MNIEMAYLLGMILGNGEIQQNSTETKITIDIPHKNLYTDDMKDTSVYVKASFSIFNFRTIDWTTFDTVGNKAFNKNYIFKIEQ